MKLETAFMATSNPTAAHDTKTPSIAIYWQEQYRNEPYYNHEFTFTDYLPAYLLGSEHYNSETSFETAEDQLCKHWADARGRSRLRWSQARNAVRAGWYHIKRARKAYGTIWARH